MHLRGGIGAPWDKKIRVFVDHEPHCAPLLELYTTVHNSISCKKLGSQVLLDQSFKNGVKMVHKNFNGLLKVGPWDHNDG